jgi:2-haloacid dehalogenase
LVSTKGPNTKISDGAFSLVQSYKFRGIMKTPTLLSLVTVFLLLSCNNLFAGKAVHSETLEGQLSKPKVIIFDVNETLLDLEGMRKSVGAAIGGREDLLPLWFSTMLHYSLVVSATGNYESFGNIGVAALQMVAEINDIEVTQEEAKNAILTPLRSLPAHPDVAQGLAKLKAQGYKLVTLTNSSLKGVQLQLKNAGLSQYFDANLSIESVGVFKPHLSTYQWAIKNLGVNADEALMVAAHGWDIAGADKAGLQTAFIRRQGKVLFPLAAQPDYNILDVNQLAITLAQFK